MNQELENFELRAAQYALGVLDNAARRRVEEDACRDQQPADAIESWTNYFLPLILALPSTVPPPEIWPRIEAALNADRYAVIDIVRPLQRRTRFWRWWGLGASVAAAVMALFIVASEPTEPTEQFVAVLQPELTEAAWLIQLDQFDLKAKARRLGPLTATAGSYELWLIPGQDATPRSMGLLPSGGESALSLSAALASTLSEGGTLAVSLEPSGGSPGGLPTGPVLYQGRLMTVTR